MLTNYHSHTEFCDGKSTMEELIVTAIEAGFSEWGISPHSPLPMLSRAPWSLQIDKVDDYIAEAQRLKEKYADRIKVFIGMEIDYIDENYNPSSDFFQRLPLDFRIGSIHMLRSPVTGEPIDIDCDISEFKKRMDYHFSGSTQKITEAYFTAITAMVEAGGFDFIGHADKIFSNTRLLSSKIADKKWYKALMENFLQLCKAKNVTLEINTKAYEKKGVFFPDERYFARMAELDIPVVINADVHRKEFITVGLREARGLYKGRIVAINTKKH